MKTPHSHLHFWKKIALVTAAPALATLAALEAASVITITGISADESQMTVTAYVPAGLEQVRLDARESMDSPWSEQRIVSVSPAGGPASFAIPKPDVAHAFFRIVAVPSAQGPEARAATTAATELDYVTIPPIGSEGGTDAVLHVKGTIDGSDRISVTRSGALWSHVNWDWPHGTVTVNNAQWKPNEKNFVTTRGHDALLPANLALDTVTLEKIKGRDVIALERSANALVVFVNDTPKGADEYEFKLHFHPVGTKAAGAANGTPAKLKISAQVDGSDSIRITATEATWKHGAFRFPSDVRVNGAAWNASNTLKNAGSTAYLPLGVDLATARVTARKGRDLATMLVEKDALLIQFADNPNGSDAYELEITFGP